MQSSELEQLRSNLLALIKAREELDKKFHAIATDIQEKEAEIAELSSALHSADASQVTDSSVVTFRKLLEIKERELTLLRLSLLPNSQQRVLLRQDIRKLYIRIAEIERQSLLGT